MSYLMFYPDGGWIKPLCSVQFYSQYVINHETCSCECIWAFLQLAPDAMIVLCRLGMQTQNFQPFICFNAS